MIKKRLKVVFIVVWLLAFLFIALPTFSFNIAGHDIKIDYSDRLANKLNAKVGNFQKSFGVYQTKEVKATLSFSNTTLTADQKQQSLLGYFDIINKRIENADLYDVTVHSEISDTNYSLVFDFPEYYANPVEYAQWLTASAKVTFETADQTNPQSVDLNDFDIIGSISLDYLDSIGSHLVMRFNSSKISTLNSTFSANKQGAYFIMNLDGIPSYFVIQYDQYAGTNDDLVRVLPTQAITLNSTKERNDYLNITRTYFLNDTLKDNFSVDESVKIINPIYKPDTATFIAVTYILSSIILGIIFFVKFKTKLFLKYLLMLSTFVLTFLAGLKVLSGNLSVSFLLGFIFVFYVVNALLYYIFENIADEDKFKAALRVIRDTSVFGFIVLTTAYKLIFNLNVFGDFIGVVLIGLVVLCIMCIIHFKFIFDLDLKKPNLPIVFKRKNETK